METTFNIPSITCSVCSNRIRTELENTGGIENVSVDLKTQSVRVVYDPSVLQPHDIGKKIKSMGYEAIQ